MVVQQLQQMRLQQHAMTPPLGEFTIAQVAGARSSFGPAASPSTPGAATTRGALSAGASRPSGLGQGSSGVGCPVSAPLSAVALMGGGPPVGDTDRSIYLEHSDRSTADSSGGSYDGDTSEEDSAAR